jgi:hypothetical protein
MNEKVYLVVRVSNLQNNDVLKELDKLIQAKGFAWFGKFGKTIKRLIIGSDNHVIVALVAKKEAQERFGFYKLTAMDYVKPSDGEFPSYYADCLPRIKTWLRLEQLDQKDTLPFDQLKIASSNWKLSEALGRSMSGHFLCKKID